MSQPSTPRGEDGQASIEHLGVMAVVAIALVAAGGGVAVAAPSVLNRVTTGIQQALCTVTGEACVTLAREPCPTLRTAKTTDQGLTIASMQLGHDQVLSIERRSDGTYAISLVEGAQRGVEGEEGADLGRGTAAVEGTASVGLRAGRTYTASTPAEARALVARLRDQKSVAVRSVIAGVADLAGLERADPQVSSYVLAGTGAVSALGKFGLGELAAVGGKLSASGELGVKIAAHERQITAYARLDGAATVFFDALQNLSLPIEHTSGGRTAKGHAVAGNPIGVQRRADAVAGGSIALRYGPGPTLLEVEVVGSVGTGSRQREIHARLDPSDPAVSSALAAWRRSPTSTDSLSALGRAAAGSAAVDVRTFATTDTHDAHEHHASIGLDGITFGGRYGSRTKVSELLEERSRPVGGLWEQRLDCVVGG
ncbi:MAG: hypothetical protein AAGC46_13430 [Solirubrobacteraceae bacterium]|nr:hypothetical protein [Patulibacter sp.]